MRPDERLTAIPVQDATLDTGNVRPLLHELQHALAALIESGTEHAIDLRSLPLTAAEEARLFALLGTGEVHATVATLGNSEVVETAVAGVWRITHYNEQGDIIGKHLEVTGCPTLLKTPPEDLADGAQHLQSLLNN